MIDSHTVPLLARLKGLGLGLLLALSLIPLAVARPRDVRPIAIQQNPNPNAILPDGTYLYGQSRVPNQIGMEYLVFRSDRGVIRGAIYYPRSEFNCFTGNLGERSLNLAVLDPETERAYPYSIARAPSAPMASHQARGISLELESYHSLSNLSANDRRMLDTCLKNF